jgi:hypothetical protein
LPERDYNLITEYIDGQLLGEQLTAFEARLQAEPDLRAEYEAHRDTVRLLQMAERVRVPRNFTLDPAVYGRPQTTSWVDRLAALFGPVPLAAASGAIMALLVFGGVLFASQGPADVSLMAGQTEADTAAMSEMAETMVETGVIEEESAGAAGAEESAPADEDMAADQPQPETATGPVPGAGGGAGGSDGDAAEGDEVFLEDMEEADTPPTPSEQPREIMPPSTPAPPPPLPDDPLPLAAPVIGGIAAVMVGIVTFVIVRRHVT